MWYSDILPAWIPIIVIGSGVYLALQMTRAHLAQERWMQEIREAIGEMEVEFDDWQKKQKEQAGPSAVLAATLPTLVTPTTDESLPAEPVKSAPAETSPQPGARETSNSWWSKLVGR